MKLDAHSPEFARLVAAWLDETAAPEEAAQLWQAVAACPECALAFAAAARFDSLLAETVQQRAGEQTALRQVAAGIVLAPPEAKPKGVTATSWLTGKTALRVAAAIAVLGLAAWLFWPQAPDVSSLAKAPVPKPQAIDDKPDRAAPPPVRRLQAVSPLEPDAVASAGTPLIERLDRFFLDAVALDQVPLREALGILQGQLQELNFLNAAVLDNLRITLPTDAAGRRITFQSGPIPFLKAVRAVAALGGCDLTLDDKVLALTLHREIFPQVPERRNLGSLLASRVTAEGNDAATDEMRIAALLADAAALGIVIDPNVPLDALDPLPITRGQWLALQALTDTRDQLSQFPVPNYHLYSAEEEIEEPDRVIDQQAVSEIRQELQRSGAQPAVVTPSMTPLFALSNPPSTLPPISVQPLGEGIQVTVNWQSTSAEFTTTGGLQLGDTSVTGVLLANQGLSVSGTISIDGATAVAVSRSANVSGVSALGADRSQIIILPATNQPPP